MAAFITPLLTGSITASVITRSNLRMPKAYLTSVAVAPPAWVVDSPVLGGLLGDPHTQRSRGAFAGVGGDGQAGSHFIGASSHVENAVSSQRCDRRSAVN